MTGMCITCERQSDRLRRHLCNRCYQAERRAARSRRDPRHWTDQERDYVLFNLGFQPIAKIAKKLGRTPYGVLCYTQFRRMGARSTIARTRGLSTRDAGVALGVPQNLVITWVQRGLLRATKVHALHAWYYSISTDDLEAFLFARGALFDLHPAADWTETVAAARAHLEQRYISRQELVARLCIASPTFNNLKDRHQFPPVAFTTPARRHWYDRAAVRDWLIAHPYWQTRQAKEAELC